MVLVMEGASAPVFTPFDQSGNVNYDVIPKYITYLKDNGVDGILVGGTTGEATLLTMEERKKVLLTWLKEAKQLNMKVIAQVGGVPLPDVIEMAKFAEQHRADAIMTLPELYHKPRMVEQLVSYLEIVSKAAPSLPLIYYHFPMMSGVHVNVKQFFTLATKRIPNFKAMKADLEVAMELADLVLPGQKIIIANHHLAPAVYMGHESSVATVTNMFPKLVQEVIRAAKSGDPNAPELQYKLNRYVDAIIAGGEYIFLSTREYSFMYEIG
ncbi:hypothetical protein O3G_MSEX009133 [Manduca sexta]|uniref:N-acetylneuraminate lyase n=1 Tax=Manduca sexta TaxID=7130 RepID=A0A921ZCA8_MANSE|nr:hypothetical protein O3G_MSEX009133 [Manduca sexta]